MDYGDLFSGAYAAVFGALSGFVSSSYLNKSSQRAAESFSKRNRSAELNLEMHKEFVGLMSARIAVWKAYQNKAVISGDPHYPDLWLVGNFYIRLAYLMDTGLLSAKDAGKLHGQNAWWWHYHYFANNRTKSLNEQNQIAQVARAWDILRSAASYDDLLMWEHPAKSYD